ncbi:hypothetical protein MMPV_005414 [Pyropia vietnamensis]
MTAASAAIAAATPASLFSSPQPHYTRLTTPVSLPPSPRDSGGSGVRRPLRPLPSSVGSMAATRLPWTASHTSCSSGGEFAGGGGGDTGGSGTYATISATAIMTAATTGMGGVPPPLRHRTAVAVMVASVVAAAAVASGLAAAIAAAAAAVAARGGGGRGGMVSVVTRGGPPAIATTLGEAPAATAPGEAAAALQPLAVSAPGLVEAIGGRREVAGGGGGEGTPPRLPPRVVRTAEVPVGGAAVDDGRLEEGAAATNPAAEVAAATTSPAPVEASTRPALAEFEAAAVAAAVAAAAGSPPTPPPHISQRRPSATVAATGAVAATVGSKATAASAAAVPGHPVIHARSSQRQRRRSPPPGAAIYLTTAGESITVLDGLCIAPDGTTSAPPQPLHCGWSWSASGRLVVPAPVTCGRKWAESFQYMRLAPPPLIANFTAVAAVGATSPTSPSPSPSPSQTLGVVGRFAAVVRAAAVAAATVATASVPVDDAHRRPTLPGVTAFLTLSPAASNLAHYTGTMTHLAHLLRHPHAYGLGGPVTAVVIAASAQAAKGFTNTSSFQSILLAAAVPGGHIAVLSPSKRPAFPLPPDTHPPYSEGANGGSGGGGVSGGGAPTVTVVLGRPAPALPVADLVSPTAGAALCLERAAVPNFPRGRWFLPAAERAVPAGRDLPLGAPAWAVATAGVAAAKARDKAVAAEGKVPVDAAPFKGAVLMACGLLQGETVGSSGSGGSGGGPPTALPTMRPILSYLIRRGRRRAFDASSEAAVRSALGRAASRSGLSLEVVDATHLSYPAQVAAVATSAVLVGIHGANLVNAAWAPEGAELVELFPRRFRHGMYAGGGGAGLGYTPLELIEASSVAIEYPGLAKYVTATTVQRDRGEGVGRNRDANGSSDSGGGGEVPASAAAIAACMAAEDTCKLWYRADGRALTVGAADPQRIEAAVAAAADRARSAAARARRVAGGEKASMAKEGEGWEELS